MEWMPIAEDPPPDALCLFFVPPSSYAHRVGEDVQTMRDMHPDVTHWKVITHAPTTEETPKEA